MVQDLILVNNIDLTTLTRSHGGAESDSKPLFNLKKCRNTLDDNPMAQEKIVVNSRDSTTLTWNLLEAESYSKPLFSQCRQNTKLCRGAVDVLSLSERKIQNVISNSISSAFCQAAQRLQNDLLTLLERMDAKDHMAMTQAAEFTFAALDHLLIGHQNFKNRVNDLLHCASSLSDIEQSMPTDDSYQRLVERCSSERTRLEEITCFHAETIDTFTKKKKQLKDLHEEISSTLEWLFQIEAEISCFEIEMRDMEIELEQISSGKEELEEKYLITLKELEESKKLFEQKEADFDAAKAAFGRARALLRG